MLCRGINTAGLRLRLVDGKEQGSRPTSKPAVSDLYRYRRSLHILHDSTVPVQQPGMLSCLHFRRVRTSRPTSQRGNNGDIVVVKNARHVEFTGKKWDQKLYRWHTGLVPYPMQI